MSNSTDRTIARRTFLRGAAGLVGASALGLPATVFAAPVAAMPLSGLHLDVMYWDGTSFVRADNLPGGDMTLSSVRLTIHGFGSTEELRSIDIHPTIRTSIGTRDAAFFAWTAAPNGSAMTRCVMPVDMMTGLRLSTHVVIGGVEDDVVTQFVVAGAAGCKMREGSYVLCGATVDWQQYEVIGGPDGALVVARSDQAPAPFQHVVITVARA